MRWRSNWITASISRSTNSSWSGSILGARNRSQLPRLKKISETGYLREGWQEFKVQLGSGMGLNTGQEPRALLRSYTGAHIHIHQVQVLGCGECDPRIFWRFWKRSGAWARTTCLSATPGLREKRDLVPLPWEERLTSVETTFPWALCGKVLEEKEWNIGWKEEGRYPDTFFTC